MINVAELPSSALALLRQCRNLIIAAFVIAAPASAQELPRVELRGQATQLIVDGSPYLVLGGELHNSSPSSPEYMVPVWDRIGRNNVNTVIGVATWELAEPQEGRFDFTAVDDQIKQARAHGMRLVMIWFGAYKNAESTYAPSWVRRDEARFPRAQRDPGSKPNGVAAFLRNGVALTPFNDRLADADARAFAALMRHLRQVDTAHTVILVQVENEVGLLADSRDRSSLANRAWTQPVPAALLNHLRRKRETLHPHLREVWAQQGYRTSGTWAQVFGTGKAADEIFMAWGFAQYVERVARAGAGEYPLPMYANAWLGPKPGQPDPGDYPSGGPVARMMDTWQAGAPSLAFLSPDIYIDDFAGTLADFHRSNNPIFVPEARAETGNLFIALGRFNAIGFSPFGIEDVPENHDLFKAYRALEPLLPRIARAQQEGRIAAFTTRPASQDKFLLGGYEITVRGPRSSVGIFGPGTGSTEQATAGGYGLVIQTARDEFLVVARAASLQFGSASGQVEVDWAQEGGFRKDEWIAGRTLNGDERHAMFPDDKLNIVRIKLLRRR